MKKGRRRISGPAFLYVGWLAIFLYNRTLSKIWDAFPNFLHFCGSVGIVIWYTVNDLLQIIISLNIVKTCPVINVKEISDIGCLVILFL